MTEDNVYLIYVTTNTPEQEYNYTMLSGKLDSENIMWYGWASKIPVLLRRVGEPETLVYADIPDNRITENIPPNKPIHLSQWLSELEHSKELKLVIIQEEPITLTQIETDHPELLI
jgi:hypothetical protein